MIRRLWRWLTRQPSDLEISVRELAAALVAAGELPLATWCYIDSRIREHRVNSAGRRVAVAAAASVLMNLLAGLRIALVPNDANKRLN